VSLRRSPHAADFTHPCRPRVPRADRALTREVVQMARAHLSARHGQRGPFGALHRPPSQGCSSALLTGLLERTGSVRSGTSAKQSVAVASWSECRRRPANGGATMTAPRSDTRAPARPLRTALIGGAVAALMMSPLAASADHGPESA